MKLDRVRLHNFLSHPDTTWELNGVRLATLVGANGAGKSAILDAIQFALFDSARARTDQLVRLGETEMSCEVVFTFAGAAYRVVRGRTTKSGGRSFLELAIAGPDGSWRPLTGDDIRSTQAAIAALLRLDEATFGTAVFLSQGQANRFAELTAAERKRVLGSVLGLDVYAAAEVLARERARDQDGELASDRRAIAILEESLARRPELEADARTAAAAETDALAAIAVAGTARDTAEKALQDLAGRLAKAKAAADEVARIEAELVSLRDRYRRAGEARAAAQSAIERTRAAAEVEITPIDVDAARAALEAAEAAERNRQVRKDQLDALAADVRAVELAHERDVAAWRTKHAAAAGLVASLEAQGRSLAPVICPKCRHRFAADPGDVAGRLDAARVALAGVGPEPEEPLAIARTRAIILRAEQALAETPADPDGLAAARRAVVDAERATGAIAAREQARAARVEAEATLSRAEAELAEVDQAGRALVASKGAAAERASGALVLERERTRLEVERSDAIAEATAAARAHAAAIETSARAGAALAALERDRVTRDQAVADVAAGEHRLAILRRLVAAFGVTGIPARIIESVLPELSGYAQELLDELRPGMELSIRAQRAKRDGKGIVEALDLIVRDAAGERPLALFSGGERMSVSLALAVGLSRLVARRAGTAIRTLVVDEPDGLDADARRAFGVALRVLAHHGELERVVLVSHHEDLAECGDAIYRVTKDDRGSAVEQIA